MSNSSEVTAGRQRDHAAQPREPSGCGGELLEIHLEELGQRSWIKAAFNTLSSSYGSAQFRFVARPPGPEIAPDDRCVFGGTFPVMRAQDLDDERLPNAWLDLAQQRLVELDDELRAQGWRRTGARGRHWWSRTYSRGRRG